MDRSYDHRYIILHLLRERERERGELRVVRAQVYMYLSPTSLLKICIQV